MSSPKVKLHLLPQRYSPASDHDLRDRLDDELVPFVPKGISIDPSQTPLLTGIQKVTNGTCWPVDLTGGVQSASLSPGGAATQTCTNMSQVLYGPVGKLGMFILAADNSTIPASQYTVQLTNGLVSGIAFTGTPPTGATIHFYRRATTPATTWALPHDNAYTGPNNSVKRLLAQADGGDAQLLTAQGSNQESITLPTAASAVTVSYYYRTNPANLFCGDWDNWVGGHLGQWPDIFQGTTNYPGDIASNTGETIIDPGYVCHYCEPTTYKQDWRQGIVDFQKPIDAHAGNADYSGDTQVRANYAHLVDIANVDEQVLERVGTSDWNYQAPADDPAWPEAAGQRWVNRNDEYLPLVVKVGENLMPATVAVSNEVLNMKS